MFNSGTQDHEEVRQKLIKASETREVIEGVVPQRDSITGPLPFNLMKSEKVVWVFQDADRIETVTQRKGRPFTRT